MAKNIISAVDVASSKICIVISSIDEENPDKPTVIGVATVLSKGIKNGVIVNIDQAMNSITEALDAAERMSGITIYSAIVSINGKHIISNNAKGVIAVGHHEEISQTDVDRVLESAKTFAMPDGREIIHVSSREFIVDGQGGIKQPVDMSGTRLEVEAHIISATTTAVHNLRKCFQQIGLGIDAIVFSGFASGKAVLTDTEKELGVMLLDIGKGTTDITIFQEDSIAYSGCILFAGAALTNDLAIGLRLSIEDAEKLKLNLSELFSRQHKKQIIGSDVPSFLKKDEQNKIKDETPEDDDLIDVTHLNIANTEKLSRHMIEEIVDARIEEVLEMVSSEVSRAGFDFRQPAGIVVTGGTANLANITKLIQKHMGVPARVGYPNGLDGLVDEIAGPAYATVQGLIVRGLDLGIDESVGSRRNQNGSGNMGGVLQKVTGWFKNLMP